MALSKSATAIGNLLTCSLCFDEYKSPRTLPCLHSFCKQCIRDLIVSLAKSKEEKITCFNCPVCKTVAKPSNPEITHSEWVEDFPENATLMMMLMKEKGINPGCGVCALLEVKSDSENWCAVCEESLCTKCTMLHTKMKFLKDHHIVPFQDIERESDGIYFRAVSDRCTSHRDKIVDQFCFDHAELCCSFCLRSKHSKCNDVSSIENIMMKRKDIYDNISKNLMPLKEGIHYLVEEKERQKAKLKLSTDKTISDAEQFVNEAKEKLDDLLEAFKKKLTMFHEEENTKINISLRLLEQFEKNIEYWMKVSSKVKTHVSDVQFFVFTETMKKELDNRVDEILTNLEKETVIDLKFEKDSAFLDASNRLDSIGSFAVSKDAKSLESILETIDSTGVFPEYKSFEKLKVSKIRSIHIPGSCLQCCTSIDKNLIIFGDCKENEDQSNRLCLYDLSREKIVSSVPIDGDPKHIIFDKERSQIFVSCYNSKLFTALVVGNAISQTSLIFSHDVDVINSGEDGDDDHDGNGDYDDDDDDDDDNEGNEEEEPKYYLGSMCFINEQVYIVVDGTVHKFDRISEPYFQRITFKECFQPNITKHTSDDEDNEDDLEYCGEIVSYNQKLIFFTKNGEIKCTAVDGQEIFCHKHDDTVKSPESMAMLPHGLILVLDSEEPQKLLLLSSDGKRQRTVLDKFDNVTSPWNIWLDPTQRILYACEDSAIDVYRIH